MAAVAPLDDPTVTSSWAGPMLLGPLIPTCVALVTIVAAQYVQLTDSVCKPPEGVKNGGCAALSLAVICSYLQVLIFSWVYLGTTVTITLGSKSFKVLKPFSRLRTVVALYGFVAVFSVAAFAMGLLWVVSPEAQGISSGSIEKAPGFSARLFYFTVGLQAIYWVMFFVLVGSVVGVFMESKKSDKGGKGKKGNVRSVVEVKHKEGSEEWFKELFQGVSEGDANIIESEKLGKFFKACGLEMDGGDISATTDKLDVEATGDITFQSVWDWYNTEGVTKKKKKKGGEKEDMEVEDMEDEEDD